MATSSTKINEEDVVVNNLKPFPPVINGRINLVKFIDASTELIAVVERLGTIFAPVKYDMQGNVDKIQKNFDYDEHSCLLELMLEEISTDKTTVTESVLWLNRALLFFELAFLETIKHLRTCNNDNYDVNMKKIFTVAYEGSVKKYHKWVTQQLFTFICKMSPTLSHFRKAMKFPDDLQAFQLALDNYNVTLHLVRCKIDDFFKDNSLLNKINEKHQ